MLEPLVPKEEVCEERRGIGAVIRTVWLPLRVVNGERVSIRMRGRVNLVGKTVLLRVAQQRHQDVGSREGQEANRGSETARRLDRLTSSDKITNTLRWFSRTTDHSGPTVVLLYLLPATQSIRR